MGMADVNVKVDPMSLPREYADALLSRRKRVQYLVVRHAGSHAFGVNLPESDIDWSAIWAAPASELLGLNPPRGTYDGHNPDWVAHELGHWCRLLLKGNPAIIEDVLDPNAWIHPLFQPVRSKIREYLWTGSVEAYLGYARAQLRLLERGKKVHTTGGYWNPKFGVHLVRLLLEGRRLSKGRLPLVRLPADEVAELMAIRLGKTERDAVVGRAVDLALEIEDARPWPWPDKPDEAGLDWLCADIRMAIEVEANK